ncbi:MAG TPA: hypothetical protein DDW52_07890 [Planctomycetaceae bacterium]|nr:hypothetical protein [Planctomycetaceae bacterium]
MPDQVSARKHFSRRNAVTALGVMSTWVVASGATCISRTRPSDLYAPPIVFESEPSLDELIGQLNNSLNIQSIESNTLKVSSPDISFRLNGSMVWQRQMNFYFEARPPGGNVLPTAIAAGSTDEKFWAKLSYPREQLVYARYAEFESLMGPRPLLPVSPIWIREAMGIIEFDPQHKHTGLQRRPNGWVEIESHIPSPRGGYIRKVVVDPKLATIHQTTLTEASTRRMIASADMSKHTYFGEVGVALPMEVHVKLLGRETLSFTVEISNYLFNQTTAESDARYEMPDSTGIDTVDLTRVLANGQFTPASTPKYTPERTATLPGHYSVR